MKKPPKTPEQLAQRGRIKDKVTLYLTVENIKYIRERAGKVGVSTSAVIDEAISQYISTIRNKKNS
jgi:hypothetical protein